MRAFLAIPIPPGLQDPLAEEAVRFRDLRPVPPRDLHLTLKFLGEIREPLPIVMALESLCAAHPPLDLTLGRVGCFPDRKKARIVWVGLVEGDLLAAALAAGIDHALAPLGFPVESRPWHGHVTLGRFRAPKRLRKSQLDRDRVFGSFRAEEVVLYSSELRPDGAIHTPIRRLPLGPPRLESGAPDVER